MDSGQAEGQHADEMHGPDAATHGSCSGSKPGAAGSPGSGPHPGREVKRGVGGERGDQDRQRDQNGIVEGRMVMHPESV
jgi:hypothetical protein